MRSTSNDTFENTMKYTNTEIRRRVIKALPLMNLVKKEIYIVDDCGYGECNGGDWRAALIDSFCQAGKTQKTFEVLNDKLKHYKSSLVLFITQANNVSNVYQVLQRASTSSEIRHHIVSDNMFRSTKVPVDGVMGGNHLVVDFWNSKHNDNMLNFASCDVWQQIIVVFDEAEYGGESSIRERLNFISKLEKSVNTIIRIIFVSATIANLSKAIVRISVDESNPKSGVINKIINEKVVEHYFAKPHPNYVGASWFMTQPNVWKRLVLPRIDTGETKEDYILSQEREICKSINDLPDSAKEFTLIVTSTRTCDHKRIASKLYRFGYNVVVELNGTNTKNYDVHYLDRAGDTKKWQIPYTLIDGRAQNSDLLEYESHNTNGQTVLSNIQTKNDYSLSHVLQATLFMRTTAENRIKQYAVPDEFTKLDCIATSMQALKSSRRPTDYPKTPRVAIVAGLLCGRGITIQNPAIDFTCTSFCFTHTRDATQRGAQNTQRFGRACGNVMEAFCRPNRTPIMIATEGIMRDAIANELTLMEKTQPIEDGTHISLKDLVSQADWSRIMTRVKQQMNKPKIVRRKYHNSNYIDGVSLEALKNYVKTNNTLVSKIVNFLYESNAKINITDLKKAVRYDKSDTQFQHNIDNGRGISCSYGKLWINEDGNIELNFAIRRCIDDLINK